MPVGFALSAAVLLVAVQLGRAVPQPVVERAVPLATSVPGRPPVLPWPDVGQAALAVPARGLLVESGPERPVPIASLTKIMTAYVILHDHPLSTMAQGPTVTIDSEDVTEAEAESTAGDSYVTVQAGEGLTERQLLNGLLVHSANNLADVLADWDAGSVPTFVTRMNAEAAALGMRDTHYTDANGLDASTVSTAGDQLRLAVAAMAVPTFAAVVAQPSVVMPLAGLVPNFVPSIGTDGIVGVKSGFTDAAMGCLVMAAERPVGGHEVLVMAAVTGQSGLAPLDTANTADLSVIDAAAGVLQERSVLREGTKAAVVSAPWQSPGVTARAGTAGTLLTWPGDRVRLTFTADRVRVGARAGTRVGTIVVCDGSEHVSVPVWTTGAVGAPTLGWRLAHG